MTTRLNIVILGLSITSSWGNGHATTYRGLVRGLARRGHRVLFLERDLPWYAENRDLPRPPYGTTELSDGLRQLRARFGDAIREADLVMLGSYVADGAVIGEWLTRTAQGITAFYDIDTPVTLAKLRRRECDYLTSALIPRFDLYLSFTGGPTLDRLEREYGSPMARPLYCAVDDTLYFPEPAETQWDLGYMGTYSDDRQPVLDALLLQPARKWPDGRFAVAGPQYPDTIRWPGNVERITHLSPREHRPFYNAQRFTLNVTRADMVAAGFSPSVRLFEAAACGTAIISDSWPGLETLFEPEQEILVSHSAEQTLAYLRDLDENRRRAIADGGRRRVLSSHTASHRAREFEEHVKSLGIGVNPAGEPQPQEVREC